MDRDALNRWPAACSMSGVASVTCMQSEQTYGYGPDNGGSREQKNSWKSNIQMTVVVGYWDVYTEVYNKWTWKRTWNWTGKWIWNWTGKCTFKCTGGKGGGEKKMRWRWCKMFLNWGRVWVGKTTAEWWGRGGGSQSHKSYSHCCHGDTHGLSEPSEDGQMDREHTYCRWKDGQGVHLVMDRGERDTGATGSCVIVT